jgi:dienelactone hydrolase
MKKIPTFLVALLLTSALPALAAVQGKEVTYRAADTTMRGYLAYDDAREENRPGILIVHEWWGHTEYARERARMLAELGYTALAVDMYGDGRQALHPEEAARFAAAVRQNLPAAQERFEAALAELRQHPTVDPEKIAAIGYCFGGAVVLEMARAGVDLKGVVSFHGSLATENRAKSGKVKAKVLVLNGADDPLVTPDEIAGFKEEMEAAGVDYRFVNYPGAKHSFTNPRADELGSKFNMPLAYHPEADARSWEAMRQFFDAIFR